ncbi:MAG: hypothetical protein NTY03_01495, partial [Candidatus Bathyarchaeota archaeon]|nr:hypothetical protein [Candidatus Bathyarchaeota archaeon]
NLTDKGLSEINELIKRNNYTQLEQDIREVILTYEKYTISKLVDFVHKEYDEYTMKENKIKNIRLDSIYKKEI